MNVKDYSEVMNLPEGQRKARTQEKKEAVFVQGSQATEVLSYLSEYFEKQILSHFLAFSMLPMDAKLEEYQTAKHSLNATLLLKKDLTEKIKAAGRLTKKTVEEEKKEKDEDDAKPYI